MGFLIEEATMDFGSIHFDELVRLYDSCADWPNRRLVHDEIARRCRSRGAMACKGMVYEPTPDDSFIRRRLLPPSGRGKRIAEKFAQNIAMRRDAETREEVAEALASRCA
jgi:hypothetical protein